MQTTSSHPGIKVRAMVGIPLNLPDGSTAQTKVITFDGMPDGREHLMLKFGEPSPETAPLVRLHSECLTGDVFGSARCDCGPQLHESMLRMASGGYLLYLRQEGRGIGLMSKLDAYGLQDLGLDTFAANRAIGRGDDERDYRVAAEMLKAVGVRRVTLLTNNPDKVAQLVTHGIDVVRQERTGVFVGIHNRRYLEAKVVHAGHALSIAPLNSQ